MNNKKIFNIMIISSLFFMMVSCASHGRKKVVQLDINELDQLQTYSIERLSWDDESKLSVYPLALRLCYQGKTAQAQKIFNQEVRAREKDPVFWNMLGSCYYWQQDWSKAKFYFELGLSIDANNIDLLHNLALVDLKEGDWQKAMISLKNILTKNPTLLMIKFNLATLYYKYYAFPMATQLLQELKNVVPTDPLVNLYLARSLIELKDYNGALKNFLDIPEKYRQTQEFANHHALILLKLGKVAQAREVLTHAHKGTRDKAEVNFKDELLVNLEFVEHQQLLLEQEKLKTEEH